MFDRFTDRARKVMGLSRQEAQRLNRDCIGTEHILLGLVFEGSGVAADILKNLAVDPKRIQQGVERLVTRGKAPPTMGSSPSRPARRGVLELALEEANNLGHNYIGTEHVLLGLVASGDAGVLRRLGVDPERVRAEVARHVTRGNAMVATGQFPFTPAMKRALELTLEEMQVLGHDSIREEHVLLRLIREEKGAAAQVLATLDVTLDAVRKALGPPDPLG